MSGSKFLYVSYIRITPEKLWLALTTPESNKAVSVWNERRKRMEGRLHVENADGSLMDSARFQERFAKAAGDELAK